MRSPNSEPRLFTMDVDASESGDDDNEEDDIESEAKIRAAAALTAISAASTFSLLLTSSSAAVSQLVGEDSGVTKPKGRYLRKGALHSPQDSFWKRILNYGVGMEFFHFISLSREWFMELVRI